PDNEDNGYCRGSGLGRVRGREPSESDNDIDPVLNQFGCQAWQPCIITPGPAVDDRYISIGSESCALQTLKKSRYQVWSGIGCSYPEIAHDWQWPRLRLRRHWPRRRADQRDELATPDHSMTSSARASSIGDTSRPRDLAVLRFSTI